MSNDKYNHLEVEDKIYKYWENHKLFEPKKNKKKFSIVIPPPNVTGILHMGHALNNVIQDVLIRIARMEGKNVVWIPGSQRLAICNTLFVRASRH